MRYLGVVVALALAGCASAGPSAGNSSPLTALQQFTRNDLTAALGQASAHGDVVAAQCWSVLLGVVDAGLPAAPPILGLASTIQAKRDLLGQGGDDQIAALRKRVRLGCSALFVEENQELIKFGIAAFPGAGALGNVLR
jgi:hypothetical protein